MNRPAVFIDTSALYALFSRVDDNHAAAVGALVALRRERARLVMTDAVRLESYVLAHARTGRAGLLRFRDVLSASAWLEVVELTAAWEASAWTLLAEQVDKDYSFVDASSFVVMRALEIGRAFAFDEHFRQAGFDVLPLSSKPRRRR